jgi:hypothetical protein
MIIAYVKKILQLIIDYGTEFDSDKKKPKHQSIDQALVDICKLKFGSSLCE